MKNTRVLALLACRGFVAVSIVAIMSAGCNKSDTVESEAPDSRLDSLNRAAAAFVPSQGTPGDTLRLPLFGEPRTMSPYASDPASRTCADLCSGRLVRIRPDGTLESALARSWSSDSQLKTWTVSMRSGLLWSDSTPLLAEDAAYSIALAFDLRYPSLNDSLKPVVLVVDSLTVSVELNRPFLHMGWVFTAPMVAAGTTPGTNLSTSPAKVCGPFVPSGVMGPRRYVFLRNPHYWRRDSSGIPLPYLDAVECAVYPDINHAHRAFSQGLVDVLVSMPGDRDGLSESFEACDYREYNLGPGQSSLLVFNGFSRSPITRFFGDQRFRDALSAALDRQSYAAALHDKSAQTVYPGLTPSLSRCAFALPPNNRPSLTDSLLQILGLVDRNGDGSREDSLGTVCSLRMRVAGWILQRKEAFTNLANALERSGIVLEPQWIPSGQAVLDHTGANDTTWDCALIGVVCDPSPLALPLFVSNAIANTRPLIPQSAGLDSLASAVLWNSHPGSQNFAQCKLARALVHHYPAIALPTPDRTVLVSNRLRNISPSPVQGVLSRIYDLFVQSDTATATPSVQ